MVYEFYRMRPLAAGAFFFCELLNVGYLSRLSGEGWMLRPKLPSSRPFAVRLPPLELVSNGWLFLRLTCNDLYWNPRAELTLRYALLLLL